MQKISYQSHRTVGAKATAQAALAMGVTTLEDGSVEIEKKLAIQERGTRHWLIEGQPLSKNQVVEYFCRRLCRGDSLVEIAGEPGAPSVQEFVSWTRENATFREAYERAKEVRAVVLSEDALTRARNSHEKRFKSDTLFVETAKWLAGKLNPKEFGEKQIHELQDNTRQLPAEQLLERLVAGLMANPDALTALAPKLREVLPPERLAEIEAKAVQARQEEAIEGEKV